MQVSNAGYIVGQIKSPIKFNTAQSRPVRTPTYTLMSVDCGARCGAEGPVGVLLPHPTCAGVPHGRRGQPVWQGQQPEWRARHCSPDCPLDRSLVQVTRSSSLRASWTCMQAMTLHLLLPTRSLFCACFIETLAPLQSPSGLLSCLKCSHYQVMH